MTITLFKPRLFAAAARFTSDDKTRDYLSGVNIEAAHAGGAYIVSTDGHRLFCGYDPDADMGGASRALIQPSRRKFSAGRFKIDGKLVLADEQARWYGHADNETPNVVEMSPTVNGEFPDWPRIVPSNMGEGDPAQFNPLHLWEFAEVRRLIENERSLHCAPVTHCGLNPALVDLGPDAFGVLMPLRDKMVDRITTPPFEIRPVD